MVDPISSIQTLFTYLTLISVPVGVFYHIMTLNNTSKNQRQTLDTRQTNILMNLYKEWGTDEYQNASWTVIELEFNDYQEFEERYGSVSDNTELNRTIFKVCWFYNGLGVLVHRELADLEMVDELFGYIVIWIWEKLEPFILRGREVFGQPKSMEWFEALYKQIMPLRE
jgi:hypothetical protein